MRFAYSTLVVLLTSLVSFAQTGNEIFGPKIQLGLEGKNEAILQMVPLARGDRFLIVGRNQLQLWNVADAKLLDSSPHHIRGYWSGGLLMKAVSFSRQENFPLYMNENRMKISPDGTLGLTVAKSDDRKSEGVFVWSLRSGESLGALSRGTSSIRDARFSDDGSTIITVHGDLKDTELALWDAKTLSHRNSIAIKDLSFQQISRDGEHVFVAAAAANKWLGVTIINYDPSDGIELRETRTGKVTKSFSDGAEKFRSMIYVSPDGKYLIDRTFTDKIVIWETAGDGRPLHRIDHPSARINSGLMGISADSRYLLTMTKNEARVYELASGNLYRRFPIREEATYTLTSDSRFAVMRAQGWVSAYDLEKEKMSFAETVKVASKSYDNEPSTETEVENTATSPDGKHMMIYGLDNIRVYSLERGELVQTLVDPARARYDSNGKLKHGGLEKGGLAGWLASGNAIYASSGDGKSVFLWNKK